MVQVLQEGICLLHLLHHLLGVLLLEFQGFLLLELWWIGWGILIQRKVELVGLDGRVGGHGTLPHHRLYTCGL